MPAALDGAFEAVVPSSSSASARVLAAREPLGVAALRTVAGLASVAVGCLLLGDVLGVRVPV
jgi:hypothetical protein